MHRTSIYKSLGIGTNAYRTVRVFRLTVSSQASPSPAAGAPLPRVVLKGGKSKLFTDGGSPIIYSGAIDRVVGRPAPVVGDPVLVTDGAERPIAWGLWNPTSMFRVRILETLDGSSERTVTPESFTSLLSQRIDQAVDLRLALGLPSNATSVFRLINSEGDGLSGLVVDVLGRDQMVVSSSAAWVERYKEQIIKLLQGKTGIENITWRPALDMLTEEGWVVEDQQPGQELEAPTASAQDIQILEHTIKYLSNPLGQKTGFYSDQREHRLRIQTLAKGKTVLDACCFSGGFAINAAVGGATSVVGVDSSAPALELATANAELNGVSDRCSFVKADVANYMKAAVQEGKQWDILILDPPKLAPNRKALPSALRKYKSLNEAALRLVKPGGLLMTCSCSGAVAQSGEFLPMLLAAAKRVGRRVTVVHVGGAGPDHTLDIGYPEGQYLTNVLLRVT